MTNDFGYAEEIYFNPALEKRGRDRRQTEMGMKGLPTQVGGHFQGAASGGTTDTFNLFPQDADFNNSAYRKWENDIRRNIGRVGRIRIKIIREDPASQKVDKLKILYVKDGELVLKEFQNKPGGR